MFKPGRERLSRSSILQINPSSQKSRRLQAKMSMMLSMQLGKPFKAELGQGLIPQTELEGFSSSLN